MEASAIPRTPLLELSDAALRLSELGPVFPCRGKVPLTPNGVKDASTEAATIAKAWQRYPDANVGLATGDLIVLDVDGEKGAESLEQLEREHGPLAPTLSASTGRGLHRYYRCPDGLTIGNSTSKLGPNLDVRGRGGYVIAPPSLHESGKRYEWIVEGAPIAELPEWLAELLKPKARAGGDVVAIRAGGDRYSIAALESEAQAVRVAPEGARNETLNTAAYNLGQLEATGALSESEIVSQLRAAAVAAGLPNAEIEQTISSGLTAGRANPRPPKEPSKALERRPVATAAARAEVLPIVEIAGKPTRDLTREALEALRAGNADSPSVFVRKGRLARVFTADTRSRIEYLSEDALRGRLDRCADWQRTTAKGAAPAAVPMAVVKDLLSLDLIRGLPEIEALIEHPVMRPDGSILTATGYDKATKLYYSPRAALELDAIPDTPTAKDAAKALEKLSEPLSEFPFATPADKANALAMILTPLVRPSIPGVIPLALVEAPRAGTGKGLLASVGAIIATGMAAELTLMPDSKEFEKVLGALLIEGATSIVLDEVEQLGGAFLTGAITATELRIRPLGVSQTERVPQRATFVALGNNVRIRGDVIRRYYPIRLDARVEIPWARTFDRTELEAWTLEHRSELLTAALTLCRAWHVAGRKGEPYKRLGGFESFTRTLGGILAHAGESNFLANVEEAQTEADDTSAELSAFLEAIAGEYGLGAQFATKDLAASIVAGGKIKDALPPALSAIDPKGLSLRLGNLLKRSRDTRYGDNGIRVERAATDTHSKVARWLVTCDSLTTE